MNKTLRQLIRDDLEPVLRQRSFLRAGVVFSRERDGVRQIVSFPSNADGFVVRLAVVIGPFYDSGELGVVLTEDLPALLGRDASAWWAVPSTQDSRVKTGHEIATALSNYGIPWLDDRANIQDVIHSLDASKLRKPEAATEFARSVGVLTKAGFQTALSPGSEASSSPSTFKPDVTKQLSYAYEHAGQWASALGAWERYCGVFPPSDASEFLKKVGERLRYLKERAGRA